MKIVKVVVDYLPKNASACPFVSNLYDMVTGGYGLICRFEPNEKCFMSVKDFITQRCPNCPLSTLPELSELPEVTE